MAESTLIQLKRFNLNGGNSPSSQNSVLDVGEPAFDVNDNLLFIGNGTDEINELYSSGKYFTPVNNIYQVKSDSIANSAILTSKLADSSVTTSKIAAGAVSNSKLNLSLGGINIDRINIPDGSIPFSKMSGKLSYDRLTDIPSTVSASTISGKLSWDNLPETEFGANKVSGNNAIKYAVRAAQDAQGYTFQDTYGSKLEFTSGTGIKMLSPSNKVLGTVTPAQLASVVSSGSSNMSWNGSISWNQIVDPPSILNMTGTIGSGTTPIYYDADRKKFFECMSYMDLIRQYGAPKFSSTSTIGSANTYVEVLSDYLKNLSGEYLVAYQIKIKNKNGGVIWNTGTGYFNTSFTSRQYFDWSSGYYSLYIEPTPTSLASNGSFRIVGSTEGGAKLAQIKYRLMKLQ